MTALPLLGEEGITEAGNVFPGEGQGFFYLGEQNWR